MYMRNEVIKLLTQLAKTGVADYIQVREYLHLSNSKLLELEEKRLIESFNRTVNGRSKRIFVLGDTGATFCKTELGILFGCRVNLNQLAHDLLLTDVFYRCPLPIQNSWQHEGELVYEIRQKYPNKTDVNCVDARVIVNGQYIGIEARGKTYTEAYIEQKIRTAITYLNCIDVKIVD